MHYGSTAPGESYNCAVPFGGVTPVLRVNNVAASRDCYVQVLGFKVDFETADFVSVSRVVWPFVRGGSGLGGTWVWIDGVDVEALYREYQASGAKIRHPPTNCSWALEMQVEVLDSNVLRIGSDPRKGEPDRWINRRRVDE
jgi:hypothetical protein